MIKHQSLILVLVLCISLTVYAQDSTSDDPALFDGQLALRHVANHVQFGAHPTGTLENILVGNIILDYLEQLGWEVSEDWHLLNFGALDSLDTESQETLKHWNLLSYDTLLENYLSIQEQNSLSDTNLVEVNQVLVPIRNLVARFGEGSNIIIIGAHYDSRIFANQDDDLANHTENVIGANDGGSGVGVLLELARVVSEYYVTNDYEIRLVFFDAEDNGRIPPWSRIDFASGYLIGSMLYSNGLDLDAENIEYMLLVDMVGDMDQYLPIEGYSNQVAPDLANAIWATAGELGYEDYFVPEVRSPIIDDHVPFIQRGISVVDIIDLDYTFWHTAADTLDKVDPDSLERVGRVLQTFLEKTEVIKRVE